MTKKLIILLVVAITLLTACGAAGVNEPADWPETVEWEQVPGILLSGSVVEVMQLHDLSVTLTMDDGSRIETVEPMIDEIFHEIAICGRPCKNIVLVTE